MAWSRHISELMTKHYNISQKSFRHLNLLLWVGLQDLPLFPGLALDCGNFLNYIKYQSWYISNSYVLVQCQIIQKMINNNIIFLLVMLNMAKFWNVVWFKWAILFSKPLFSLCCLCSSYSPWSPCYQALLAPHTLHAIHEIHALPPFPPCTLGPHSKFQNPRTTTSLMKLSLK